MNVKKWNFVWLFAFFVIFAMTPTIVKAKGYTSTLN
jgi:hypothetical protein